MKLKIFFPFLLMLLALQVVAAPPVEEGKAIFTTRCNSCHNVNKILLGPALAGVEQRHSIDWIVKFVKSSQTVIKSGDKDAVALFTKFNNIPMPDHVDLSEENIKNVVEYIKSQASTAPADLAPFAKPEKLHPAWVPVSSSNYVFFFGYLTLVALLIGVLVFFVKVKEYERKKSI